MKKTPSPVKVGLFAPASAVPETDLEAAKSFLNRHNLPFRFLSDVSAQTRYNAGPPERRLREFISLWEDDSVTHLWALRGGYGCPQLYEGLSDYFKTSKHTPKPVMGFSDLTALLCGLHHQFPEAPFFWHGPNLANPIFLQAPEDYQKKVMSYFLYPQSNSQWHRFKPEDQLGVWTGDKKLAGTVVGGNLTLLASICGTDWQCDLSGKILLVEEWNEAPYRVDRLFTQLLNSSNLRDAKAVLLGELINCENPTKEQGWTEEFLQEFSLRANIPFIKNCPFGHGRQNIPFAFGSLAEIDSSQKTISIMMQP